MASGLDCDAKRASCTGTVALLGPRQVGKTTLALEQIENNSNATYLDLESK
jgi:predicted AAA+ superfamily ATPase